MYLVISFLVSSGSFEPFLSFSYYYFSLLSRGLFCVPSSNCVQCSSASHSPTLQMEHCLGCIDGRKGLCIREVRAYHQEMWFSVPELACLPGIQFWTFHCRSKLNFLKENFLGPFLTPLYCCFLPCFQQFHYRACHLALLPGFYLNSLWSSHIKTMRDSSMQLVKDIAFLVHPCNWNSCPGSKLSPHI